MTTRNSFLHPRLFALALLAACLAFASPMWAAHCDELGGDTDGDDVCDPVDNCPLDANPTQDDADTDTIGDACDLCPNDAANDADADGVCGDVDNCPADANPGQENADADASGDACDPCPNDASNDADSDGVCGGVDNCPLDANPTQDDSDTDTVGDACDLCPFDASNDADTDGVCGDVDNCPADANPGQENADSDANGDACDLCPNDPNDDGDADGVCGDLDNCPNVANASQADSDLDDVGDACDGERYVAPTGSDSGDCREQADPCLTIQYAVDQANPDERVLIAAGVYAEQVSITKPLRIDGAQSGVAPAGRTAGGPAESIVDASGLSQAFTITSGDVTIDGLEIAGDASTFAGIFLTGSSDLFNVTIRNTLIHGMALANPSDAFGDVAYGVYSSTGSPGARHQISNLVVEDNEIFDIGLEPSSAGAGLWLENVVGNSPGLGAAITGNSIHDIATLGTRPSRGSAILIEAAEDDAGGEPTTPGSGVLVSGNTYENAFLGATLLATASEVSESASAFTGVTVQIANVARLATVDTAALGTWVESGDLLEDLIPIDMLGLEADGYFGTIQGAIDASRTNAEVTVSAGTFAEPVAAAVSVRLRGAKAGQDARIRDTGSGETIVTGGIRVRANAVVVDGFTVANDSGPAVQADAASVVGTTVKNVFIDGGTDGIQLARSLSATITQNLILDVTGAGIDVGTDANTVNLADDVVTVATIENNEIVGTPFGITGYMKLSAVQLNEVRDYTGPVPGAAVSGQLADSIVGSNTLTGYTQTSGILLTGDPQRPLSSNTNFKCNTLADNLFGIEIDSTQTALVGISFSNNDIAGNTIGLVNESANAATASFNWWGCAAGPPEAGCDLIVPAAGAVTAPFLTAPSDCSGCFQNADCTDGVTCNGAEICNLGTNQCEPGTPPNCDLGGSEADCNVAECVQGVGCQVTPVEDGTACDDGVACSVADSCQAGDCIAAGGGDPDGDLVCAADDNCPAVANPGQDDLDQDGTGDACDETVGDMQVDKIALRSASGGPNGRVVMKGSLVIGPGDVIDATGTVTVRVTDSNGFVYQSFFSAPQCGEKKGKVICRSSDKARRIQFKPNKGSGILGAYKVKYQDKKMNVSRLFVGPLTFQVQHSDGVVRVGTASDCSPNSLLIQCKG